MEAKQHTFASVWQEDVDSTLHFHYGTRHTDKNNPQNPRINKLRLDCKEKAQTRAENSIILHQMKDEINK